MTGFDSQGHPDDPSNRPTRMANYGAIDQQPPGADGPTEHSQPPDHDTAPAPWYRNRTLLAVWATMVAILVVLIIYGLLQLSHGGGGGTSTTTPSTTPSSSTTPSTTTTTPSTTTTTPSSSSAPEQAPSGGNPPPAGGAPPPAQPPQHHHLPHIPPTISLPHTVITLPHGF
jgi:cytoskeletal protein RodZ